MSYVRLQPCGKRLPVERRPKISPSDPLLVHRNGLENELKQLALDGKRDLQLLLFKGKNKLL
jgi:hypothetical protein